MTEQRDNTNHNYFLTSWSMEGVEVIIDITEHYVDQFDVVQAKLAGEESPMKGNEANCLLNGMLMRARFQTNRFEVWGLLTTKEVTQEALRAWAEADPQGYVDMVRERGVPFHHDPRMNTRKPVIV